MSPSGLSPLRSATRAANHSNESRCQRKTTSPDRTLISLLIAHLRREGSRFREVFAAFSARGIVTRRLERMPYGLAEFEITDPDGYVMRLSQKLEDASDLPTPENVRRK